MWQGSLPSWPCCDDFPQASGLSCGGPDKVQPNSASGCSIIYNYPAPRPPAVAFIYREKYRTLNNGLFKMGGYF